MEIIYQPMKLIDWFEPVYSGITFGLLLAIMLGPVFFSLLQTSLHESFKAGAHLAFGVLLSDATLITVCYTFASLIRMIDNHQKAMSWAGGLLLIGFGVFNFFHRIKLKEVDDNKKTVHAHFVLKGFLLNILNPAVLFFWLGVVGLVSVKDGYSRGNEITFFCSTLATVFSTDLFKCYLAQRIKNILKPSVMLWINRITGIVLIGFGINMILR
jgi:threonine/homoserine/homoserine lactone efflux protein